MNIHTEGSFVDFRSILTQTQINHEQKLILKNYLKLVFEDLRSRFQSETDDYLITRSIFADYLNLPILVSNKIFNAFNDNLTSNTMCITNFIEGICNLYSGPLNTLIKLISKIFCFNYNTEQIYQEDVILVLDSFEFIDYEDIKKIIEEFFGTFDHISITDFVKNNLNNNSNIFIMFIFFIYHKKPFNEESLNYYSKNMQRIINTGTNCNETNISAKDSNEDTFIIRPSNEVIKIIHYLFNFDFIKLKRKYESRSFTSNNIEKISDPDQVTKSISMLKLKSPEISDIRKNVYDSNNEQLELSVYCLNENQILDKIKLVLVDKDIFIFTIKQNKTEEVFNFDSIRRLSGYTIILNKQLKINDKKLFSFVLIRSFGNRKTNIKSIFFCDDFKRMTKFVIKIQNLTHYKDFNDYYSLEIIESDKEELGHGHFGTVKIAIDRNTSEKVAVKIIKKGNLKTEKIIEITKKEIDIMKYLSKHPHPNIIKPISCFEDIDHIYLVMELIQGGSLSSFLINKEELLKENEIKNFISQITNSVYFLHQHGIIHRDIKPENILLTEKSSNATLKLIDFGLSGYLGKEEISMKNSGTMLYAAPEIIKGDTHDKKADVWSLGVLSYFIASGSFPFDDSDSKKIPQKICTYPVVFNKSTNFKTELKSFIQSCLLKHPEERATIYELINHKVYSY
jgi:tRNA A-37 threonylcarbamoyl transferase component Bud32